MSWLNKHKEKQNKKGNTFSYKIADPKGITSTLTARYYKDGSEILLNDFLAKDISPDPAAKSNFRKLTVVEAERLQGFPDGYTSGVSDTQRYKTLGNAVSTNVITALMNQMFKDTEYERE